MAGGAWQAVIHRNNLHRLLTTLNLWQIPFKRIFVDMDQRTNPDRSLSSTYTDFESHLLESPQGWYSQLSRESPGGVQTKYILPQVAKNLLGGSKERVTTR